MNPVTAYRARVDANREATAHENRERLRELVLEAHDATGRCERLVSGVPEPLDLSAVRAALDQAIRAASRARNRAVLDAKTDLAQEAGR